MNFPNSRAAVIFAALLLSTLTVTSAWSQSSSEAQQERLQRSFTVAPGATLEVENYKGTIHVTGGDGNQVVVDVYKHFEGSASDRNWWMDNLKIDFRNDPHRLAIKVDYPSYTCIFCWQTHDWTAGVELEIRVPRQINVRLDGYKPDIRISAITGDIAIKSYKAPMVIDATTGAIRIDTYKDSIRLRDVSIRGSLQVKSYKADADISAKSLGESDELENSKGSIVLRVPASAGFNVDFEGGRHSSFSSDFALNSSAGYSSREVRGTVNQGGARLRLRTEKGSVQLRKISGQI